MCLLWKTDLKWPLFCLMLQAEFINDICLYSCIEHYVVSYISNKDGKHYNKNKKTKIQEANMKTHTYLWYLYYWKIIEIQESYFLKKLWKQIQFIRKQIVPFVWSFPICDTFA